MRSLTVRGTLHTAVPLCCCVALYTDS
jgi:hypothetical protein